ncbi:hypothetical protein HanXRQr2_Chr11g0507621 [Helianthus annuus]|uniref:Uncharacterized protein n=1 Tax=Helianthus annuus TaxID=4232 RepID=A0A9K3N1B3_HELAN|nr:hypothetical protein HanXRQr2_Chr11g0507621 [Helianthus annuus]KAJ0876492.1 hypothetical protein HanPSC8_Chr11g0489111 [Helianthus annuus]
MLYLLLWRLAAMVEVSALTVDSIVAAKAVEMAVTVVEMKATAAVDNTQFSNSDKES